jgi:Asp/Glu/hydantoin racemase
MSLEEIRERVESAPRLLVAKANEGGYTHPASVYEEEDGLNTVCYLPGEYSGEWQDVLAGEIVAAYEDRARLLAALDAVCKAVAGLAESLAEDEMEAGARSVAARAIANWKPRD